MTNECPQGHAYTPDNVYYLNGWRYCRTCRKRRSRDRARAMRAALKRESAKQAA